MTIPVNISLSIQKDLKKLNYCLLEAGDEFKCQKRQFHGTFNLYNPDKNDSTDRQRTCWNAKKVLTFLLSVLTSD